MVGDFDLNAMIPRTAYRAIKAERDQLAARVKELEETIKAITEIQYEPQGGEWGQGCAAILEMARHMADLVLDEKCKAEQKELERIAAECAYAEWQIEQDRLYGD